MYVPLAVKIEELRVVRPIDYCGVYLLFTVYITCCRLVKLNRYGRGNAIPRPHVILNDIPLHNILCICVPLWNPQRLHNGFDVRFCRVLLFSNLCTYIIIALCTSASIVVILSWDATVCAIWAHCITFIGFTATVYREPKNRRIASIIFPNETCGRPTTCNRTGATLSDRLLSSQQYGYIQYYVFVRGFLVQCRI